MKLIYISDSAIPSPSPNSVHVMKMCQAFAKKGIRTLLLGKNVNSCHKNVDNIYSYYAVSETFDVSIFPPRPFRGSGHFYNLSLIIRLIFLKADLFYTRSITAAFLLHLYRKKFIFEIHEPYETKSLRLRFMNRCILKSSNLQVLVLITEALNVYYSTLFPSVKSRILVAHDGADAINPVPPVLPVQERLTLGYVGSLYEGKGMEIISALVRRLPEVDFHVVGGLPNQIKHWKNETRDAPNIIFHGFRTQDKLPGFLFSFDILIAPYSNRVIVHDGSRANNLALWMSPLKLFEYMSTGKPIITTKLPVIEEILTDSKQAMLCESDDLDSWVDAISFLKKNPDIAATMGMAAKEKFLSQYTWDQRVNNIMSRLKTLHA